MCSSQQDPVRQTGERVGLDRTDQAPVRCVIERNACMMRTSERGQGCRPRSMRTKRSVPSRGACVAPPHSTRCRMTSAAVRGDEPRGSRVGSDAVRVSGWLEQRRHVTGRAKASRSSLPTADPTTRQLGDRESGRAMVPDSCRALRHLRTTAVDTAQLSTPWTGYPGRPSTRDDD